MNVLASALAVFIATVTLTAPPITLLHAAPTRPHVSDNLILTLPTAPINAADPPACRSIVAVFDRDERETRELLQTLDQLDELGRQSPELKVDIDPDAAARLRQQYREALQQNLDARQGLESLCWQARR